MATVSISCGNSKMGSIPSVSLPSVVTCRECDCHKKCYARKLERLRPAVRNAYKRNLDILTSDPDTYWREVEASIMMSRFFRFHVSGDIPSPEYFSKMVEIAKRNSHCQILCFTKKYEVVNSYINKEYLDSIFGTTIHHQLCNLWMIAEQFIPRNLHIIFSAWDNLPLYNPYELPVAYVRFRDGHTDAPEGAVNCSGNCTECATTDGGCWSLQKGESVVFNEH